MGSNPIMDIASCIKFLVYIIYRRQCYQTVSIAVVLRTSEALLGIGDFSRSGENVVAQTCPLNLLTCFMILAGYISRHKDTSTHEGV